MGKKNPGCQESFSDFDYLDFRFAEDSTVTRYYPPSFPESLAWSYCVSGGHFGYKWGKGMKHDQSLAD
jgi:hypothetical protein